MKMTELDKQFPFTGSEGRSDGLHLSTIIHDFLNMMHGQEESEIDDNVRLMFEKGFLWEKVLSRAYAERAVHRPDEIVVDGIACSPDGIATEEDGEVVVEEYKATSRSVTTTPDMVESWMMQIKAYCYVVGVNVGLFYVLHLNGDYRAVRHPIPKWYRCEFSEQELAENWHMIVGHAKMRGWLA